MRRAREGGEAIPPKGPAHEFPPEKGREADQLGGGAGREPAREGDEAVIHDRERIIDAGREEGEPRGGQGA